MQSGSKHLQLSCRAMALHLCVHFVRQAFPFDAVFHLGSNATVSQVKLQIDHVNSQTLDAQKVLLWVDIREETTFDLLQEFVNSKIQEENVYFIITSNFDNSESVKQYLTNLDLKQVFCDPQEQGIAASQLPMEIQIRGIPSENGKLLKLDAVKVALEKALDTNLQAMFLDSDGTLITQVLARDVCSPERQF